MIKQFIEWLKMSITMQLKKLNKEKEEQDATLREINRKLDLLIVEIARLKTQSSTPLIKEVTKAVKDKKWIKSEDKLYIPEVDIDGMEVKAGVKEIDNKKNIAGNIDKLNKLGADK